MSESLLAAAQNGVAIGPARGVAVLPRPAEVPEKFWDNDSGALRVDALLRSYLELERKLSQRATPPAADAPDEERLRFRRLLGVPDAPDGYEICPRHELCNADPEVNARLHEAGFTPAQAQLVYDLAAERLLPVIAEAAKEYEAQRQLDRLRDEFGGEERFARVAGQIAAWGRANLPAEVFGALSTTAEGVMALHRMMAKGEPVMGRDAEPTGATDEEGLRKMMRDPRYWRSREPDFVRRVTEGFRRLTAG